MTKPNAWSLHVGLNAVDPHHYAGWEGILAGCENDAKSMQQVAATAGFSTHILLTRDAVAAAVLSCLRDYVSLAEAGDIIMFTNSSHGGQIFDENGDEADGMDETICMFDRELVDDELAAVWAKAKPGVRILMVSDSCHSGTVVRMMPVPVRGDYRSKEMHPAVAVMTYEANKDVYDPILRDPALRESKGQVKANVLSIGACQDNQLSYDGDVNGLFTEKLLKVWSDGQFTGTYGTLIPRVRRLMPPDQSPEFRYVGPNDAGLTAFVAQRPFKV